MDKDQEEMVRVRYRLRKVAGSERVVGVLDEEIRVREEEGPAIELAKLEDLTPEVERVWKEQVGRGEAPIYEMADGRKLCFVKLDWSKSDEELLAMFEAYLEVHVRGNKEG